MVQRALKYVGMVVVCDDGSTDATYEEAKRAGALVVRHEKNRGYGAALRTLFAVAKKIDPDAMVVLDADGQHDPSYIPMLVEPVLAGEADIVVGSRFLGDADVPAYRELGIKVITWPIRFVAYPGLKDAQSGFRAYSRRAVRLIDVVERGMGASTEILLKGAIYGLKLREVPVKVSYRGVVPRISPWRHGLLVLLVTVKYMLIHLVRKLVKW